MDAVYWPRYSKNIYIFNKHLEIGYEKYKKSKNEQSQECHVSNVAFGKDFNLAPLAPFTVFTPCGTNLLECNTLPINLNVIMTGIGFHALGALAYNLFDLKIESLTNRCFYLHEFFIMLHLAFHYSLVKWSYFNSIEAF